VCRNTSHDLPAEKKPNRRQWWLKAEVMYGTDGKLKRLLQTPPMRDREPSLQPYQNLTHDEMFFKYFTDNLCPDIRPRFARQANRDWYCTPKMIAINK